MNGFMPALYADVGHSSRSVGSSCCNQAIALKNHSEELSDNSDPIRQHGVQGQVLALTDIDKD
jgi:hypothetical protein